MLPMITIITNFHTENKILYTKKMDENSEMENNAGEKNTEIWVVKFGSNVSIDTV